MTSVPSNQTLQVGERIADYRLVRFIGAGGMGEVYEAQHRTSGTRWAIKFLRRDHACRPDLLARFEQEARIANTLNSRHIVKVREFCVAQSARPYMVMDLAEGRSLANVLTEHGPLEIARALDLAHQACVGLCAAHDRRIVHRDLKPDNLYVCPQDDGTELLKILDFGIAKHLGAGGSGPTTETGSNLGTAYYMSPEQAQGARDAVDHRTDIYSLGVILYEMLSGRRPYEGESYNEILIRIVTQRPVPLETFCANVPRALAQIVDRAMQRDSAERFQSASEFAIALAPLVASKIESTCFGLALKPPTRPRSPDLSTLETCSSTANRAAIPREEPTRDEESRLVHAPVSKQSPHRRAHVKMQFVLAMAATAIVTVLVLWLHEASRDHRAPETEGYSAPTALPVHSGTAQVGRTTEPFAKVPPVVPSDETTPSAETLAETMGTEKQKGLPRVSAAPLSTRSRRVAPQPQIDAHPARKTPTIDDPLPPNPHALGVSPVME